MASRTLGFPGQRKIIWVANTFSGAFSQDIEPQLSPLRWVRSIFPNAQVLVEPVFVIPEREIGYGLGFLGVSPFELSPSAETSAAILLSKAEEETPDLLTPRFLSQRGSGGREAAIEVVCHVLKTGGEIIAVSTNGAFGWAGGWRRGFLKHLIQLSPVPVLVINASCGAPSSLSGLVLYSDQMTRSWLVLEKLLLQLGGAEGGADGEPNGQVVLLQKSQRGASPSAPEVEQRKLTEWADGLGIRLKQDLGADSKRRLVRQITDNARELSHSMVILASSRTGGDPGERDVLAQGVIRKANCPILIMGSTRVPEVTQRPRPQPQLELIINR